MKFFSLDDNEFNWKESPDHPWVLNNEDKINTYKSLAQKYISDDSSYDLIVPNFKSFYLSELPISILSKFLNIMFYQNSAYHGYGTYTRSIVKEKLLFVDEDNVTLRYICANCPYIIDCIYSSSLNEKVVINEAISFVIIFSYVESFLYIFDPNKHPILLPCIIYDDLSNGDFFYDIDIFSLYKSYFNGINKLLKGYLRRNSIKLSSLPPISSIVNNDIKFFLDDRTKRSYQDFYHQLYSINSNNHYFLKILIISLVILLAVIIHKSSYGPPKFLHVFNDFSNQSPDINTDNSANNDSLSGRVKDNRTKFDFHDNSSRIPPIKIVKAPRPIIWNSNDMSVISKDEIKHNITHDTIETTYEIVKAPRPILWSSNDMSVISKDEIKRNLTDDTIETTYEIVKAPRPILWGNDDVAISSNGEIKRNISEHLIETLDETSPLVIASQPTNHNDASKPIVWNISDYPFQEYGTYFSTHHFEGDQNSLISYDSPKYDLGTIDKNSEFYLLNIKCYYELPDKKAGRNMSRNQNNARSKNTSASKSRRNNNIRRK